MSPSKMRRTNWFRDGEAARQMGEPRDSNPFDGDPAHYVRRRAWWQGWDEAELHMPEPPTPFDEALARGDLTTALLFADDMDALKAVLTAVVERLETA